MKKFLIIENQYFPTVNWYKASFSRQYIILSRCERFQKMTFRNRTVICGANGLINLSVPVEQGRDQKLPFGEVRISYRDNWQMNHWRGIVSCYGKSPFFEFYRSDMEKLFSRRYTFLFDMNFEIIGWLNKMLQLPAQIQVEENFVENTDADNMTNNWLPKNFQARAPLVTYTQVFEDRIGFQTNVSIMDLLFNTGPAAGKLLQ